MVLEAVKELLPCFLVGIFVASVHGQQVVYDCPQGWASFEDRCYHFVFYPPRPYDEASQACHQVGANLVSVTSSSEHSFISSWLTQYDGAKQYQWFTSGVERAGDRRWEGDGEAIQSQNAYWLDASTQAALANSLAEAHLVYEYTEEDKRFGWSWVARTKALPYICEIYRSEVYRIYHQNRDFSYGNPSNDPNDWHFGPKFTFQSPNIVFVGRMPQINIECAASGNPSPTYKWYRDFGTAKQVEISSRTSSRYTVTNGRLTISNPNKDLDPGKYTCVAENPIGKVISKPVEVSSGFLDEFSNDKPGSQTAMLYLGAKLVCSPPNYNPALVYQWVKNDDTFIRPEMNPHTFLSENGNLYFSEIQAADAAEYHCIITLVAPQGREMATSQPFYENSLGIPLKVSGENPNEFGPDIHDDFPAVFPRQPLVGQEMRIECLAYGRLPLHYSWSRVDGKIPMDRTTFSSLNRIMHIKDARLEDSGIYMCTVQGLKNVDSRNISVNVAAAPYFLFPLKDQFLDVGSHLTWVCDAVAIPRAEYEWYKNGERLGSNAGVDIAVDRNVLTISSADAEKHNGMYECIASNDYGTEVSIAEIRVLAFKPTFEKNPVENHLRGTVGGNLTIFCRPDGAPQPLITWTRNGAPIGGGGRAEVLQNGNLVLSSLTMGDAGTYTCIAENSEGKATSSGDLSIIRQTVLSIKPVDQTVHQNNTAHIPCQASFNVGETDLVYVWYFNGQLIDFSIDPSYSISEQNGIGGLYVIGAQFRHEGWYECKATTVYDTVGARAYLKVQGAPGPPAGVHIHGNPVGTTVDLWWQPGESRADAITMYRIQYSNNFTAGWVTYIPPNGRDIMAYTTTIEDGQYPQWRHYVIKDELSPGTYYRFRVTAASANFGYGEPSLPSEAVKLADAPPIYAPDVITGGGGSVGTLTIKWKPLPLVHHGGKGLYYRAYFRKHGRPNDMWQSSQGKIFGNNVDRDGFVVFNKMLTAQDFYTEYDVKVQAINNMGPGPNSSEVIVMSAEDIPVTTPQQVWAEGVNSTAGHISWQLPNNTREGMRGKIMGFQINWWPWGEDRLYFRFTRIYGNQLTGIVIGLPYPNGDYWVDVQVFNSAGLSRPSGKAYLNTLYEPPRHYPDMVTIQSDGEDTVCINWRGVSWYKQIEAPVWGYKVWYWPYTNDIRTAKVATFGRFATTGILHGIEKDKVYKARVLSFNQGGDGKKTPPTFFTLGGQVRFDPVTTEIMASAGFLRPSVITTLVCLMFFSFLHK